MNYLVFWNDIRLFAGKNQRPTVVHQHPVIQLVVATDGAFKTKVRDTENWVHKKGLLVKPNHLHQCDATNVDIISLEINPDTPLGAWILAEIFGDDQILEYPSERFQQINPVLIHDFLRSGNWGQLHAYIREVFQFDSGSVPLAKDERIDSVLNYIHENISDKLSTEQLIKVAFLSESRLLHLFKEQMGLPIRNYILWYRLKIAVEQITDGASLTEAAHRAGFSDQSHFTRNCLKMIGVPPSTITKNSKFVQVSFSF